MALPASGAITLGQVNTELGRSATQQIQMNDNAVRTLAQVGGINTVIAMQDLRGKSAITLAIQGSTGPVFYAVNTNALDLAVKLVIGSNGSIALFDASSGIFDVFTPDTSITRLVPAGNGFDGTVLRMPTAWITPLTAGIGSDFEVQYSGSFEVLYSGSALRFFDDEAYYGESQENIFTTSFYSLSSDLTITLLATGSTGSPSFAALGSSIASASTVVNGTISIRRIGTTSPVASFTINAINIDKQGD